MGLTEKDVIARRIAINAAEIINQMKGAHLVNLGIGMPTQISNFITNENIYLHAENGMVGIGPLAVGDQIDMQRINAGRQPVTEIKGSVYIDSSEAFGMIRGGHVSMTVLGAFQVDQDRNIANWINPNGKQLGVGGAMDLVKGANQVMIAMTHTNDGSPKLVKKCTLPITAYHEADIVITELGVFYFEENRVTLRKMAQETTVEHIRSVTEIEFEVAGTIAHMIT